MDVMSDLFARAQARGAAFAWTLASGSWAVSYDTVPGLAVHVIVDGTVALDLDRSAAPTDGRASIELSGGDIVLVRGDVAHRLGDNAATHPVPLSTVIDDGVVPGSTRTYRVGDGPRSPAAFFCGAYQFEGDLCGGLLAALPPVVHLRPRPGTTLRASLEVLTRELDGDTPGQQTLLDRLLDVVLIQVLREHFADPDQRAPGWIRAEHDPPVARSLRAFHETPGDDWTVDALANIAGLSRSAFARRFRDATGDTPIGYVTQWRMAFARDLLRTTDDTLAAIASSVGYRSEFAFATAFKRHHDTPPGRWRRRHTDTTTSAGRAS